MSGDTGGRLHIAWATFELSAQRFEMPRRGKTYRHGRGGAERRCSNSASNRNGKRAQRASVAPLRSFRTQCAWPMTAGAALVQSVRHKERKSRRARSKAEQRPICPFGTLAGKALSSLAGAAQPPRGREAALVKVHDAHGPVGVAAGVSACSGVDLGPCAEVSLFRFRWGVIRAEETPKGSGGWCTAIPRTHLRRPEGLGSKQLPTALNKGRVSARFNESVRQCSL
jgi:hypothetical protein